MAVGTHALELGTWVVDEDDDAELAQRLRRACKRRRVEQCDGCELVELADGVHAGGGTVLADIVCTEEKVGRKVAVGNGARVVHGEILDASKDDVLGDLGTDTREARDADACVHHAGHSGDAVYIHLAAVLVEHGTGDSVVASVSTGHESERGVAGRDHAGKAAGASGGLGDAEGGHFNLNLLLLYMLYIVY